MRLDVADSKTKCTPVCTVVAIGRQVIQCFDGDTHLHRCASKLGVQHKHNAQGPRKRCRECIQSAKRMVITQLASVSRVQRMQYEPNLLGGDG